MGFDLENLPDDWQVKSIREVTVRTSYRDPGKQPDKIFRYVDVSSVDNVLCKIRNVTELKGSEAPSRARKDIRSNDVLFATVRPTLKRVALIPHELDGEIASTGYCVLRANEEKVEPTFLYDCLITDWFIDAIGKLERGASYPAVRDSDVFNTKIPLPPLVEQRKIAGVLGVVQRAIEQQEQLLQRTTELKKTLLHHLFTHGLRGEPQKKTEIGLVPESWEVVSLEKLVENTPQVNMRSEAQREIQYIDVSSISREFLRIESTNGYRLEDAPGRARKKVKTGDVIFATVRPTLLRVARVTEKYDEQVCSTAFCVLRDRNKNTNGRFIYYLIQRERFVKQLAAIESGASYPAVTDRQVKAQLVPLPREQEQLEIAAILEASDVKIRMHASKKRAIEDLFRTLLHHLMTAQIRVNDLNLLDIKTI